MSKKTTNKNTLANPLRVQKQGAPTPETTLGKVLFVRRTAEQIVAILNNVSDYVISNNVNLHDADVVEQEKVQSTLVLLEELASKLSKEVVELAH